MINQLRRIILS